MYSQGEQRWVQVSLLLSESEPVLGLMGSWTKELLFAPGSCYFPSLGVFSTLIP